MKTANHGVITSITAPQALDAYTAVAYDGTYSTTKAKLGIVIASTASGQQAPVVVTGIAIMKTAGAITAGALITPNASGLATTGGSITIGTALDAATASNEFIRVLLS